MCPKWLPILAIVFLSAALQGCSGRAIPAPPPLDFPTPTVTMEATPVPVWEPTPLLPTATVPRAPSTAIWEPAPLPSAASAVVTFYVANTDGEGVYIRRTPNRADRLKAWADGTPITVWPGETATGDGWTWYRARGPDGITGWIPRQYLVEGSGGGAASSAASSSAGTSVGGVEARVTRVIDGDTIDVSISGQTFTVRYIGIDTPETVHPSQPVGCYGPEASRKNGDLVGGKVVVLEKDVSEVDKYGRLLRYVWVGDVMVNAELVRLGYAQVSTYPPDVSYQDLFLRLQREAREAGRGLWGNCGQTQTAPPVEPTAKPQSNCHPSYPTVCIPPPPPDLDCKDVSYRRFRVLQPDPHRFDGDRDGVGCE